MAIAHVCLFFFLVFLAVILCMSVPFVVVVWLGSILMLFVLRWLYVWRFCRFGSSWWWGGGMTLAWFRASLNAWGWLVCLCLKSSWN